jgi:hypothetical protein
MPKRPNSQPFDPGDVAAEIVRRALPDQRVILLSDPPTAEERLQILAASLQGIPIIVADRYEMTMDEWVARYCTGKGQSDNAQAAERT